jgi:tRNA-dihydrouridine synthase 2
MLAAEYGADITYGEEIVNHRLLRCTRKINIAGMLGTVNLVEKSMDTFVVQTCDEEKSCGVFQIETSDVVWVLQAANLVSHSPSVAE